MNNKLLTPTLTAAVAALAFFPATAQAATLSINGFSGTFSNPVGGSDITYQNNSYTPSFLDSESQIRWGDPANDDNEQSGLGFAGWAATQTIDVDQLANDGQTFVFGRLRHFNETIWSGTAASATDLALALDFGNGVGSKTFNFTLAIDETLNQQTTCPYYTDPGKGCSDKISWVGQIATEDSFEFNGKKYTLEMAGFSDRYDGTGQIVNNFISQEDGTSKAYVYARIVPVEDPNPPTPVPEPTSMLLLSLGALGVEIARRNRQS